MKKGIFILLTLFFFTTAYSQIEEKKSEKEVASKKGAWNDSDKKAALKAIKSIEAELDVFGKNKQQFIDCYLRKVEAKYSSFATANMDSKGCEKLATQCATSTLKSAEEDSKSMKGNWSKEDIKRMKNTIAEIDSDLDGLGKDKQPFIHCYMSRLENAYSSFYAADNDEKGCERLATECLKYLGYE